MTPDTSHLTPIVLSHFQVAPLLRAQRERVGARRNIAYRGSCDRIQMHRRCASTASRFLLSPDLGLTTVTVELDAEGIAFPNGIRLTWDDAEKIAANKNACFALEHGTVRKIQTFSALTNRSYSLYPTPSAPTLLIGGFAMHRITDGDPYRDTLAKVKTLAPIVGRVLDTATGLGYTAIEAAKTAAQVVTIELDPAVLEIARQNPWSRALFNHPRIEQRIGDSVEIVPTFDAMTFDVVIHDPPTLSLAGDLYAYEFYCQLYRVLKRGGKLFHYVGDPQSKLGTNVTRGVIERLRRAGFQHIHRRPHAFGVTAQK